MAHTSDWENPHVVGRNREPVHTPLGAYADAASALACDRSASPFVKSLNGSWKFALAPDPVSAPAGFEADDFDDSAWADLPVPGNWELNGHGTAIYTNIIYPFDTSFELAPPRVPTDNPTGCYRTRFTVPESWRGRSVFLLFESVDSAFYLYVNGVEVGYSQDSKLPAEFDVTPYLRRGDNTVAVKVLRFCDGFYLEDQDYWHVSGIQRDVTLYAKPRRHIRDFSVRTTFDSQYRDAELCVRAFVANTPVCGPGSAPDAPWVVEAMLYDAAGDAVGAAGVSAPVKTWSPMYGDGTATDEHGSALVRIPLRAPNAWTPETPYLYTLVLTLKDPAGAAVDFESSRVGFRQVEIVDGVVLLNGRRLVVRGVDRHEWNAWRGRAVTDDDMIADIRAMKQLNFNAVRTSHYPNHPRWYDLCDRYGICLVDEANLETHGVHALLSKDPEWAYAFLERARRMVLRDRNHPSILFWSLGNECLVGPHHAAMAAWIRAFDPTRPVQYESGNPGPEVTDIMVPMYPSLDWVERVMADHTEKRPMIMCEYAYAKGNSTGNFAKFWEMVYRHPRFQGGFVWDWSDKAIARTTPDGRPYFAYGGERGEITDPDPQMCLNGVVWPDRTPHPGAYEIKHVQAPVRVSVRGDEAERARRLLGGRLTIENRYHTLDLSHLAIRWEITEDGRAVQSGSVVPPATPAGARGEFVVPFATIARPAAGSEYFLNLRIELARDEAWASRGHVVSWEQFRLPVDVPARVRAPAGTMPALEIVERDDKVVIAGPAFRIVFDRSIGTIASFAARGLELLASGPAERFHRAPTDIDQGGGERSFAARWRFAGLDRLVRTVRGVEIARLSDRAARVAVAARCQAAAKPHGIDSLVVYTIYGTGQVLVEHTVRADEALPPLARVGLELVLPARFGRVEWLGRGPYENYVDRCSSAAVGRYALGVDELYTPYIFPSECGGREGVRWVALADDAGAGLLCVGTEPLHIDALRYTVDDLERARRAIDLTPRDAITLHLDGWHTGVGGDTGWNPNIHPEYQLRPGRYAYSFRLQALAPGDDANLRARAGVEGQV